MPTSRHLAVPSRHLGVPSGHFRLGVGGAEQARRGVLSGHGAERARRIVRFCPTALSTVSPNDP